MLPIADRWFEIKRISDDITLLREPHVTPLIELVDAYLARRA